MCICIFILLEVCLQLRLLDVGLLVQKISALVVLLGFLDFPWNGGTSARSHSSECASSHTFLPSGGVVIFLIVADLIHGKWYPCFNLHFSNYRWVWTTLYMFGGHFLFFFFLFGESPVYIFFRFYQVFGPLLLIFKNSLSIRDFSPAWHVSIFCLSL